jgi:uncharacterized protein
MESARADGLSAGGSHCDQLPGAHEQGRRRRDVYTFTERALESQTATAYSYGVSGQGEEGPTELSRLLGRDYWLILSTPEAGTDQAAIEAHVGEHVRWLLGLEREDVLFLSGPLLSGPGTGPGSGATVIRAADQDAARSIAARDPFVLAGLRKFTVHRWRLNEGSIGVRISLATATYDWL